MRKTLEKAFEEAARLPEEEQELLASAILEELALTQRWEETLSASRDALEKLADEAIAEHRAGGSEPLDQDAI